MDASVLTTKLYVPPPRPDLVKRPHLVERLDDGLRAGHRLTLVSASAGSGKTTLLGQWVAAIQEPVAWLSLDEDDNDPVRFWAYVVAALQEADPQIGQSAMPMLRGPQPPPARSILTPLLNEVAALSKQIVLVLDDYHLVTEPAIHDDVAFLLDHLPRQLHLVVATRADPPLPVARLRARGQLAELRADDLRFTPEEVAVFLNDVMGLGLQPEDVAALEVRTEGWAAGLHLAALSMQGRDDAHTFVEAFTGGHHYILEYLIEEVVSRQPEPVQRFLLQTSILDRLCAPLCDTVTGGHGAADMLERLQRDNLFIVPLDDERRWYRYHHLFGDLLRKRLGQVSPVISSTSFDFAQDRRAGRGEAILEELHRRASQWHEENGLLEQAVKHARAAQDLERLARLAEQAAGASLLDARLTTLLRWVEVLPGDVLRAHPRLQIYRAWALYMNGHLEAAQEALRGCRQALESLPPSPENDALRRELTRLLDTIDMIARGLMHSLDHRIEEAIRVCSRARELALEDGHVFLAVQATEGLALARYHQGRLRASAQLCQQVIDLAAQSAAHAPMAAAGYVELAGVHTEWNDLETAADLLDQALALCRQWGVIQTLSEAHVARSRLLQAGGDIEGAWEALEEARRVGSMEGEYSMVSFRLSAQQACLNLQAGELDKVVRWVEGTKAAFISDEGSVQLPAAFVETLQVTLARAYLARGEAEEALAVLEPLFAPAEAAGGLLCVVEVCALKALALQAVGDIAAALVSLGRSLTLAEPEGYVRMYLNAGPPMAQLLRGAASRGIQAEYANELLAAFEVSQYGRTGKLPPPTPAHPHTQPLIEPLTPRELEILHLVNAGLSNQDIADRLFIALNTVKRHTSSIYGKLGVESRTQAAARARELGLLFPTQQQ
jgi:LuxR family maltose regulon positive regulatory protein